MLGCDVVVLLFWICMMGLWFGGTSLLDMDDGMYICMWFQLNHVCHDAAQILSISCSYCYRNVAAI